MANRFSAMILATELLLGTTSVHAQTAESLYFFKDVNTTNPSPAPDLLVALLKDGFEQTRRTNRQVCVPTSIEVSDIKPATADANVWAGIRAGQLKNAWTMRADMPGCALSFANYIVLRLNADNANPNAFREVIYSRGTTHAGLSLSKDAMMGAVGAITIALQTAKVDSVSTKCDHPVFGIREIVDDRKAGPDVYGVRFTGEWTEKWHFQACGRDVAISIKFTADGQGGAYYHVDPKNNTVQ